MEGGDGTVYGMQYIYCHAARAFQVAQGAMVCRHSPVGGRCCQITAS
jgi:hypothetical protein